jgi:3-oxoacyl-[acyl-carrier-protein] synthase III
MGRGHYLENSYMESVGGNKPASMLNHRPAYWINPRVEYDKGLHHLSQMFNEQLRNHFHEEEGSVFYQGLKRMINRYPIDLEKIRFFQVNFPSRHIAEIVLEECENLGIPKSAFYSKMASMGYVGPPMVFICLDKIMREEEMKKGDLVLSFVTEVSKFMQAGFTFQYC